MMHESIEDGAWFAARRFGIGIGLPIAWQGWVLLASYLAALAGIKALDHSTLAGGKPLAFALFLPITAVFLIVAGKRTRRNTKTAPSREKEAQAMSGEETLFVCYRKGWQFNCQPRGRAGWLALAAWTLPLLPLGLGLAWLLLRFPDSALPIGIAFTLIVLLWSAVMAVWIVSRSEMVDLRAQPKPETRRRKNRL